MLADEEIARLWAHTEDPSEFARAIETRIRGEVIAKSATTEPVGNPDKFNRLTEVEVLALMNRDIHGYSLICAVENQLAEKNK